jgi:predicted phosphohydrolase
MGNNMRLAWLTDIHLNFLDADARKRFYQDIIKTGCEGVLISGDIAEAPSVQGLLQELVELVEKPTYFVLGNHDYYRGQVNEVRREMTALSASSQNLFWLTALEPVRLSQDTFLVGQDGWADGRLGNYQDSRVVLRDCKMIADLFQAKALGHFQLQEKMQELADQDAKKLEESLLQAVAEHPKKIIVLTHIPPFKEVCLYEGKISGDDWLPYFSSKASGDVLKNVCTAHPDIDFLVLCGHTHSQAKDSPFPNLVVEVGHAEYYQPEIQKLITVE